ncbi:MAG: PDZ domain-containing protein [Candidatus Brocadiae bacterium]|nr:PDZ domain-containing protein [Candidatus Brocadiia bacterium]
MKVLIPAVLAAFLLGGVAGVLFERRGAGRPEGGETADGGADTGAQAATRGAGAEERAAAAESRAAEAETRLTQARERIAALEKSADGGKKPGKKKLTPEEAAAKAGELRGKIADLVAKKDGKALVKLMHELAALGEAGYMGAIEISGLLWEDVEGGKGEFGLSQNDFYMSFGGPMVPVMVWGLEQGDKVPSGFRIGSAWSLPWQRDVDAAGIFLDALRTEKDPDVARALAQNLSGVMKPEHEAALLDAARANLSNPAVATSLMDALASTGSDDAWRALQEFSGSEDPGIRAEAQLQMIAMRPPDTGIMITQTFPNTQAEVVGIRRGDIITNYNGTPVRDMDGLRDLIQKTSSEEVVSLTINRGGTLIPLQVKGQKIGINGKGVAPK